MIVVGIKVDEIKVAVKSGNERELSRRMTKLVTVDLVRYFLLFVLCRSEVLARSMTKKDIEQLTQKTWGTVYKPSDILDKNVVNCQFNEDGSNKQSQSKYMKCTKPEDFCFRAIYLIKKNNTVTYLKTRERQGCLPSFAAFNCSSSYCGPDLLDKVGKSNKSEITLFCCCSGSLCNSDHNKNLVVSYTRNQYDKPNNSTLVLTMILSCVTLVFIIVCLILLYCYKQKHRNDNTAHRLSTVVYHGRESDTDSNGESISEETLENMLHGNLIHQGCHSAVRLGIYENKTVAVKVFPPRSKSQWRNEKEIYKMLGPHPNVAQFMTSFQVLNDISFQGVIVMSYYSEGSLLNFLRHRTVNWKQLIRLAYSIVNGLAFLHGESDDQISSLHHHSIAHRDLNSRNILVKADGTCVLADFGFALRQNINKKPPEKYPAIGSPRYMAPEVLDGSIVLRRWTLALKQIDSYALGLVLWELARRCHDAYKPDAVVPDCMLPFEEELGAGPSINKVRYHVCTRKMRPKFPTEWKSKHFALSYLTMMIQECWDQDSDARLTPLCVLNRIRQIQDASCAEALIYKETLERNTGLYVDHVPDESQKLCNGESCEFNDIKADDVSNDNDATKLLIVT